MKKLFLFIGSAMLLASCNNRAEKEIAGSEIDSTEVPLTRLVWQAADNDSGRLEMKQVVAEDPGPPTVPAIISYLNEQNPEIILRFLKTSNDTVYLHIDDATYLTQRMGSSGPIFYLATVVYNLTDLPGIRFVNLDFEEGDHASPNTFERTTFREKRIQ